MTETVVCETCKRKFKDKPAYESHIHPGYDCKEFILCDHCKLLFKTFGGLSKHFYENHKGDKYHDDRFILLRTDGNGFPCAFRELAEHVRNKSKNDNCQTVIAQNGDTFVPKRMQYNSEPPFRINNYGIPNTSRFLTRSSL